MHDDVRPFDRTAAVLFGEVIKCLSLARPMADIPTLIILWKTEIGHRLTAIGRSACRQSDRFQKSANDMIDRNPFGLSAIANKNSVAQRRSDESADVFNGGVAAAV